MKDIKRRFCSFSFYDQQAIQEMLEDMAGRGWMLQKTGNFMWTYKRIEPKRLRFSVTYFPGASDFDPGPTEGELTKIDFCSRDGWTLAARWGTMQIFYNENEAAVPIETEPVAQVENIRRAMKKNVLLPQILMCASMLFYLSAKMVQLKSDLAGCLADPFYLYSLLMFGGLLLAGLCEIVFYFSWSRKALKAAERDGMFLPVRRRPAASWILTAFSLLCLLLACSTMETPLGFALIWPCAMLLIMVAGNTVKSRLKKRGASRGVNRTVSVGSVFVLTVLCIGGLTASVISGEVRFSGRKTAVGTYELYGRTMEIYDDPLPLEIEDLADVRAEWSKEASRRETFFLSNTEYRQYAVPVGGNSGIDERELQYTVTVVKRRFLYDFIKRAVLGARQDEVGDGFVFTDHYEPVDASVWDAGEAYQLHWSDSVLNTYLICWENRIVEIKFYWEPDSRQIAVAAEKLRGL